VLTSKGAGMYSDVNEVSPRPMNAREMHSRDVENKLRAEVCDQQQIVGLAGTAGSITGNRYTLRDESAKSAAYHTDEAQKHSAAAAFLKEYPQFDDFIRLVRSGAIRF